MLIEQIIAFELRGPGPLYLPVHVLVQLVIFMKKTKIFKENLRVDYYLLLKYCTRQYILISPTLVQSLTKFNRKMQDFKRVLDLNCG